jgi:hypothetical protein
MLQLIREWNNYFFAFHLNSTGKWRYNNSYGVVEVLAKRIEADYPSKYEKVIEKYTKIRTFLRIRHINKQIDQKKLNQRNFWKRKQFSKSGAPDVDPEVVENADVEMF